MLCVLVILLLASPSWASDDITQNFFNCLSWTYTPTTLLSSSLYTPNNASFESVLNSTAQNFRYLGPDVPKPSLIYVPLSPSEVQTAVWCARRIRVHLRIRSGGHDYEALSYVSRFGAPFILLDLQKLDAVLANTDDKTAWVMAGATTGQLYEKIAMQSDVLAFAGGLYDSIGIGGHISGGGYGGIMRKYGLAVDNVIDALMVDARGYILDRKAMGEDAFWAIRGGGGGNFGAILYWKLQLVSVPGTVTVFTVPRTLEQGATNLVMKWQQISYNLDERLFLRLIIAPVPKRTVVVLFNALFLGSAKELLDIMGASFPELGLTRNDCNEMSWIQSVVYMGSYANGTLPEYLLKKVAPFRNAFKNKSDFTKQPIPEDGLLGLWKFVMQEDTSLVIMNPFGGAVNKMAVNSTAFGSRDCINMIQYVVTWEQADKDSEIRHMNWSRSLYNYMEPFVSKNPRLAYANYRDLDLGINKNGEASYWEVRESYGLKYFDKNFEKLARVKAKIDPGNFFHHEQSIPPLCWRNG